jgi:hypothetical protein
MAEGMFKKPPTGGGLKELTARQQRRKQYLERRGREYKGGGRVSAMPIDENGGEMTARQARRKQYLERQRANRERAVADYRAQQARQAEQQMPPGTFRSDNPQDPNLYTRMPDGSIAGTYMAYPGQGLPPDLGSSLGELPQRPDMSLDNTFIGKMGELPPGTSLADYANAISGGFQQQPARTPTPEYVNAMPGQPRTGTFTPQGRYRPLPWYATPQQIRERQALIETGGYFQQPLPSQRMR